MVSAIVETLIFLIRTVLDLFFLLVLMRLLFQYFKVEFYNPFYQYILKITNTILIPIQKIIPRSPKIDLSVVSLLIGIKAFELLLITFLASGSIPKIGNLIIWPLGEILTQTIHVLCLAIFVGSLLSWMQPYRQTPLSAILYQITEPLLSRARKAVPSGIGIDISPILVIVGLQAIEILLTRFLGNILLSASLK